MQGEWVRKPVGETSVVFVHGILSSGKKCWRNSNGAYWLELLEQESELAKPGILSTPIKPLFLVVPSALAI